MNYSPPARVSKSVVVDANIAARAVIPLEISRIYLAHFERWHDEQVNVFAPEFWCAEVVSVIRQYAYRKIITRAEAGDALDDLFDLHVELISPDRDLFQRALEWAEKIGQAKVYDAFYLACAERLEAEFWTADRRLFRAVQRAGVDWIKWVGELE